MKEFKRNDCLDVAKFVMASLIIVLHTIQMICYEKYIAYGLLHMPQRLCVPMFFLISSFFFWYSIQKSENVYKAFLKNIIRWVICYLFWAFIHLRFYYYNWYYPTTGILWFFYALILGNIIVFLFTRLVKNKYVLFGCSVILLIFMVLADAWYGVAVGVPVINELIAGYYNIFKTLSSGFTYGVLFSMISYLLVTEYWNREKKLNKKKHLGLVLVLILLYSVEGYYTYLNRYPREYGFYLFMVPLCIAIFTLLLKLDIKIPHAACLGKMSTLMYYIHIMIYYHWLGFYGGLFSEKTELIKDIHAFIYVYVFTTWLAFAIFLISKKAKILRKLF